jgi:hypothetical protein
MPDYTSAEEEREALVKAAELRFQQPLYNPQEGIQGRREGGPYLDEVELMREEDVRAHQEGRKPNYSNMRGLVPAQELKDNPYSNPEYTDREDVPNMGEIIKKAVTGKGADLQQPGLSDSTFSDRPLRESAQELHERIHGEPVTGETPGSPGSLKGRIEALEDEDRPDRVLATEPMPVRNLVAQFNAGPDEAVEGGNVVRVEPGPGDNKDDIAKTKEQQLKDALRDSSSDDEEDDSASNKSGAAKVPDKEQTGNKAPETSKRAETPPVAASSSTKESDGPSISDKAKSVVSKSTDPKSSPKSGK